MGFTHSIAKSVVTSGRSVHEIVRCDGDAQNSCDPTIPANAVDHHVPFGLDVSELRCIFIVSTVNLVLKTNSASEPTDTINLLANVPYVWHAKEYFPNRITGDITGLYFDNPGDVDANVCIEALTGVPS